MSEATKFGVLALAGSVSGEVSAEFCFIFGGMVELLYSVVRELAGIAIFAFEILEKRTRIGRVLQDIQISPPVLRAMVVDALLMVMVRLDFAFNSFECIQIEFVFVLLLGLI